jgi:uncharacterized Zn-finger protein
MNYLIDSAGRRKKAQYIVCDFCGKDFLKQTYYIGKTKNNFCCRECVYAFQRKEQVELKCSYCSTLFKVKQSRLSKSIHQVYFCSRICRDKAQRIDHNLSCLWPSHYRTGKYVDYRKLAFDKLENKCNRCSTTIALVVHHIDRNRENNSLLNLEILCSNCHYLEHHA